MRSTASASRSRASELPWLLLMGGPFSSESGRREYRSRRPTYLVVVTDLRPTAVLVKALLTPGLARAPTGRTSLPSGVVEACSNPPIGCGTFRPFFRYMHPAGPGFHGSPPSSKSQKAAKRTTLTSDLPTRSGASDRHG